MTDPIRQRETQPLFHVVPQDDSKKQTAVPLELPTFDDKTRADVRQFVFNANNAASGQPDWSSMPDDLLAKQETAATIRKDYPTLVAIGSEWTRRKEVRSEPAMRDPETLKTSFDVTAERAKHERFVAFAANPMNRVSKDVRAKHEAYIATLDTRMKSVRATEAVAPKVNEFMTKLHASGMKLSPADEARVRAAFEDHILHPPPLPGPAIGPAKDGVPLEEIAADVRARWEIVDLAAHSPFAAAAYASSVLHGDTIEQTVVRMKGAENAGEAWEAHATGLEESHTDRFYGKDTFH